MRKPSLSQIVYNATFPRPRNSDPGSFAAHINRHLVPEVRLETNNFYGPLDCIEAQYPGLDYSHPPHRMRLSRFPWHRRLFRVFDELGLTREEISGLCCWEGTKSARTRYEQDEGVTVNDTTGQAIARATPAAPPSVIIHNNDFCGPEDDEHDLAIETGSVDTVRASDCQSRSESELSDYRALELEEDFSDEEVESCGLALNQRLMVASAARDQGDDVPLDEDWEQWLKEAGERGSYEMLHAIRSNQPLPLFLDTTSSRRSRAGLPPASTLTAESFLYTTSSSNAFSSSPVLPQGSNHAHSTAR